MELEHIVWNVHVHVQEASGGMERKLGVDK